MDPNKNYYNILGIDKNSTEAEIKKSYRKKANETHPDKQGGNDKLFKEINEAYQVLGDKQKKIKYDSQSPHGKNFTGGGFGNFGSFSFNHDPFSMFEQFFNRGFQGYTQQQQRENFKEDLDIVANMNIDLKRVYENKPITIKYKKRVKCNPCRGTGFDRDSESFECEVCDGRGKDVYGFRCESCLGEGKIYSGTCKTCNGEKVVLREQEIVLEKTYTIRSSTKNINRGFGHHSKYYREKVGSLIVNINFVKDEKYDIKDYDLHHTKNIHFQDAIEGKEIIYTHVDRSQIKVKLPKKTKDGDVIRLKDKGLLKDDNTRGDLYIKINITIDYERL